MYSIEVKSNRQYLLERLKQENAFWSFNQDSISDVPDDILVELVMVCLDLNDIDLLLNKKLVA